MVKTYFKFRELPVNAIRPDGWLRTYLERQRHGLTGYLENAGYPFNRSYWGFDKIGKGKFWDAWGPYEQTGYWIDGMTRCGHLLRDTFLLRKTKKIINAVLSRPDSDGYLGSQIMKIPKNWNRWPHAVFFRAVLADYSVTKDRRYLNALARHYLSGTSPHWDGREVCNAEIMFWLYEKTGNKQLLDAALTAYSEFNRRFPKHDATVKNMLSGKKATEHAITYLEMSKLGALTYLYTGIRRYLKATVNAFRKLDRNHMLIDGIPSSTERLTGRDSLASHETCAIADFIWSAGYLLLATGSAEYADMIERAAFNGGPGAIKKDFKALQYFSCPNQVIADKFSNHNVYMRGRAWMSFRPNPGTECCPGDVNRVMPGFGCRMWLSDGKNGLVAAFYGPGRVTALLGPKKTPVTIVEETNYPFSEQVDFTIKSGKPARFNLSLRIPCWCSKPELFINNLPLKMRLRPGTFIAINRVFMHGDRLTLHLPMKLKITHWPGNGIGIERGPLAFSLPVKENWKIDKKDKRSTKKFPAWNLYPASDWNYALDIKNTRDIRIIRKEAGTYPWDQQDTPLVLNVPARRVSGWKIRKTKSVLYTTSYVDFKREKGNFRLTPPLPVKKALSGHISSKKESITLVPYGCTHLRITIFPDAGKRQTC